MTGHYDPWADLASRPGVELKWHTGAVSKWREPMGVTNYRNLSITLRLGMDEAQLRTTLAHELVHLERGPVGLRWANRTVAREEARVHLIAAQRLIDPDDYDEWLMGRADSGKITPFEARRFCRVDVKTLLAYRTWRKRVTAATVARVHAQVARPAAWPPAWLTENADQYATAARFAAARTAPVSSETIVAKLEEVQTKIDLLAQQ